MGETILIGIIGKSNWEIYSSYYYQGEKMEAPLSLLALEQFIKPDKLLVLGTEEALAIQAEHLKNIPEENKIIIPPGNTEEQMKEMFSSFLVNLKGKRIILDVTQGFRSQPILLFLAGFIKGLFRPESLQVYYSMDITGEENQLKELGIEKEEKKKYFSFITIEHYLDLGYMSLIFSLFAKSFNIPSIITVQSPELKEISKLLEELAQDILENYIHGAIAKAGLVQEKLTAFLNGPLGQHLESSAQSTLKLVQQIEELEKKEMWEKMFEFGKLMLYRKYLLNAATFLSESIPLFIWSVRKEQMQPYLKPNRIPGKNISYYTLGQAIKEVLKNGEMELKRRDFAENFQKVNGQAMSQAVLGEYCELRSLVKNVCEIRNNAAHGFLNFEVNSKKDNYEKKLRIAYNEFNQVVNNKKS